MANSVHCHQMLINKRGFLVLSCLAIILNGVVASFLAKITIKSTASPLCLNNRVKPKQQQKKLSLLLASSNQEQLSSLPDGISVYEKSESKSMDVQADFRSRAMTTLEKATEDGLKLCEFEFPPLIGGEKSKSQFDDFDNVQELDKNKDWSVLFAASLLSSAKRSTSLQNGKLWLVFPDLKECEIAKKEWAGQRFRATTFTTIEAVTSFLQGEGSYDAPWGSSLVSGLSKIMGGDDGDAGLLGDMKALDDLVPGKNSPAELALIIQPGNGGPVEDWINCEKIHDSEPNTQLVVINGALDKLRGGYYPAVFFPKLAKSVDRFFNRFESVFYLKPISDKGCYGWLYRVYPEPWQVVKQTPVEKKGFLEVENTIVFTSKERPDYNTAVAKLLSSNK